MQLLLSALSLLCNSQAPTHVIPPYYVQAAKECHVPWYWIAAVDQYGKTVSHKEKGDKTPELYDGFHFRPHEWAGFLNPRRDDTTAASIAIFGGKGTDGDRDGRAEPANPYDRSASLGRFISRDGNSRDDYRRELWMYFQQEEAVAQIEGLARVYQTFDSISLPDRVFPLNKRYHYSYKDTWGDPRGFGGRRMHEGTDVFASYGTPLLSTCYGFVQLKGWNQFGGWRIGIRSADNIYFYYAHLSSFARGIAQGDIVRPGQVIGYVGSSGYGRPGTSGKFPPHLHFGIYRTKNGYELPTDPYPYLRRWERLPQSVIPERPHP